MKVWALRFLVIATIVSLTFVTGSNAPALGLMVAWTPNVLFLVGFQQRVLRFPRFLEPVSPIEPALYRWLGVGLLKPIVASPLWPMIHGADPPAKLTDRQALLDRTETDAKRAEICHLATFFVVIFAALYYRSDGRITEAAWITGFTVLLNGYPVLLQRVHRLRVRNLRAPERRKGVQTPEGG